MNAAEELRAGVSRGWREVEPLSRDAGGSAVLLGKVRGFEPNPTFKNRNGGHRRLKGPQSSSESCPRADAGHPPTLAFVESHPSPQNALGLGPHRLPVSLA